MITDDEDEENLNNFLDAKGYCKYCKNLCKNRDLPLKTKVFSDDSGKKFIIDANGNRVYLQTNANG
jgi:hypothetical protein